MFARRPFIAFDDRYDEKIIIKVESIACIAWDSSTETSCVHMSTGQTVRVSNKPDYIWEKIKEAIDWKEREKE